MLKWIKFLEKMWLMLAILSLLIAGYKFFKSVDDAGFFVIFSVMSTVLYFLRKRQRKSIESQQQENNKNQ